MNDTSKLLLFFFVLLLLFIVLLLIINFTNTSYTKKIGGCEGTRFSCCPDGITSKRDEWGTNCQSLQDLTPPMQDLIPPMQDLTPPTGIQQTDKLSKSQPMGI